MIATVLSIALIVALPLCLVAIVFFAIIYSIARDQGGLSQIRLHAKATDAVIQSVTDTGVRMTRWYLGSNAQVLKLGLLVTPPGGGEPFPVEQECPCPAFYLPALVPGARIPVVLSRDRSGTPSAVPYWNGISPVAFSAGGGLVGSGSGGAADEDAPRRG